MGRPGFGSNDATVKLWDVATGKTTARTEGAHEGGRTRACQPGRQGCWRVRERATAPSSWWRSRLRRNTATPRVAHVGWSAPWRSALIGKTLISGSWARAGYGDVRVAISMVSPPQRPRRVRGYSPTSPMWATGSFDKAVRLWDLNRVGQKEVHHPHRAYW